MTCPSTKVPMYEVPGTISIPIGRRLEAHGWPMVNLDEAGAKERWPNGIHPLQAKSLPH